MITFTPEELFRFAARLKTNLDEEQITHRVNEVIRRLKLE